MLALLVLFALSFPSDSKYVSDVYPASVANFEVRTDKFSKQSVKSGLLHNLPPTNTLAEFNRLLQCPSLQSDLNFNSGMVSMMRMFKLSEDLLKYGCSYLESIADHGCQSIAECKIHLAKYETGDYQRAKFLKINQWSRAHLYRVINGTLKMDWPWGMERFENGTAKEALGDTVIALIKMTLDRISDIRDSVFFTSGDTPGIPFDLPIPIFGHSTSDPYAEIVWPWFEMWQDATSAYRKIRSAGLEFTNEAYEKTEEGYLSWDKKVPKAAYYASDQSLIRQIMYDVARLNPDLFDAGFPDERIFNWNPMSTEDSLTSEQKKALYHNASAVADAQSLPAGFALPLANLSSFGNIVRYHPGSYKYVVVPLSRDLATSNRLQHILSHSGAVALIQRSRTKFHFSAQLKPWVHYVPLSFSGADVGEKVRWLRDHDDLARQIAENGRNFARSYLRLEDFYCYAASALEMLAELTGGPGGAASSVWNPVDLPPLDPHFVKAAYEYPV